MCGYMSVCLCVRVYVCEVDRDAVSVSDCV